jgi:hypothetical protein
VLPRKPQISAPTFAPKNKNKIRIQIENVKKVNSTEKQQSKRDLISDRCLKERERKRKREREKRERKKREKRNQRNAKQ